MYMYVHTHFTHHAHTHSHVHAHICAYTVVHSHAHRLTPTQLVSSWSYVEVHVLLIFPPIGAGLGTHRNINIHVYTLIISLVRGLHLKSNLDPTIPGNWYQVLLSMGHYTYTTIHTYSLVCIPIADCECSLAC